uniref:NAC transcription factor 19 n=1 Tax=Litchi chinensis TaxID=151069 RepID=A0A8K1MD12_LITCN|nr:NAC transcription factor 19 [Litchi chinensis]
MEKRTWSSNAGLPVGCRFDPTDQQLILDYLLNKVNNNPLPSPTAVIDCDVYGEGIAWRRLFEESEEDSLYFFTKLKKKTGKGKRVDRVTDCGTWKGQQRDKEIYTHGDQRVHIGSKRSFSFVPKKGFQENRGKWVMHEYRLEGCLLDKKNNFYVICRIKKKRSKRSNATYDDDDDHFDVDVNGAAICVPNDVQGHHSHVFDNYMGDGSKECLNVSDCVAGNGVGEYLNASYCVGGDGTGEFLNGGDGLYVSNYMMGGDGNGDCLNVSIYVGGDGLNHCSYMGGDSIGECLNGGDGLNVSNCMGGRNGIGGYLNASNCMGGDDIGEYSKVSDYIGGDDTGDCFNGCDDDGLQVSNFIIGDGSGECFNISESIGGDGIGECLNVSAYMEEWFSLLNNDNNHHPWSSNLANPDDIGK